MTVIAWDGHTLSADRLISCGSLKMTGTKIANIGGALVGCCGEFDFCAEMMHWFREGCQRDKFPPQQSGGNFAEMVVVWPDKTVWKYDRAPSPMKFDPQIFAIGSGRDFALAAMHLGKTSSEAVEVACVFDIGCGCGVDTLKHTTGFKS